MDMIHFHSPIEKNPISFKALLKAALVLLAFFAPRLAPAYTSEDYYAAGFLQYVQKDYANTILYMKTAVQMDARNWKAHQVMGYCYYLTGDRMNALRAFENSLRYNPNNPALMELVERIRAEFMAEAEAKDTYPKAFKKFAMWVRLRAGLATAALGDLPAAAKAFNSYYASYSPSASVDGFGRLGGLEVCFMLDRWNAWGVAVDGAAFNGYKASDTDVFHNTESMDIQPNMVAVQLEYYRFFQVENYRLYATAAGGVYNSLVNLTYTWNEQTYTGKMDGLGFGGQLGVGGEMAIGDQFSLCFFIRGRYATSGNIQGDFSGTWGLAGLAIDPNGILMPYPAEHIEPDGLKFAKIDYTGADFGLAITYHY
jgi:tetratricopeptide (TPR) repeat protein